jgi:hypothetical protein
VGDMGSARQGYKIGKSGWGWFYGNQICLASKQDFMEGKGELDPWLPKGINKTPWAPKEGWWFIQSLESRWQEGEAPGGSRRSSQVLELPRRWPRPCPSRHGWPCEVKPWWSSEAHVLIPSRQLYTLHSMVFSLIWSTSMSALFICIASICF